METMETFDSLKPRNGGDAPIPNREAVPTDTEVSIAGPEDIEADKELIF